MFCCSRGTLILISASYHGSKNKERQKNLNDCLIRLLKKVLERTHLIIPTQLFSLFVLHATTRLFFVGVVLFIHDSFVHRAVGHIKQDVGEIAK